MTTNKPLYSFQNFDKPVVERGPDVIGKWDGTKEPRSQTKLIGSVTVEIPAIADSLTVKLYQSLGDANRGGVVITVEGARDSGFVPHAVLTENGVELHMAGDGEAEALLTAMVYLLNMERRRGFVRDVKIRAGQEPR